MKIDIVQFENGTYGLRNGRFKHSYVYAGIPFKQWGWLGPSRTHRCAMSSLEEAKKLRQQIKNKEVVYSPTDYGEVVEDV